MRCTAPHYGTQCDDAVKPSARGRVFNCQRNLECTGHMHDFNRMLTDAVIRKRTYCAGDELIYDFGIALVVVSN